MLGKDNKGKPHFNRRRLAVLSILLILTIVNGNQTSLNPITLIQGNKFEDLSLTRTYTMKSSPMATNGTVQWERTYGGKADDRGYAIIQTTDGGFALTGTTYSYGCSSGSFFLMKIDVNGNLEWQQTYCNIYGTSRMIIQTADSGFVLAGMGSGGKKIIVKTDSIGNIMWEQIYGVYSSSWYPQAFSGIQTADGGFAIGSYVNSNGAGDQDFWLVKIDENGKILWEQTYNRSEEDLAFTVIQTLDSGFALVGSIINNGLGNDGWLVKTDENGKILWEQTYGGEAADKLYTLIQTADGGYILAGETNSFNAEDQDFWLVKTDENGITEWQKTYGSAGLETPYAVIQTTDGGFALAGSTSGWPPRFDGWVVKTDIQGNEQWTQIYGGPLRDEMFSVIETADGGLALTGYMGRDPMEGSADVWLVKIAPIPLTTPPTPPFGDDSWQTRAPMPTPRENLAAVVVNERIYAIGGYNGTHNLATVEEYDPTTDSWRSRAPMPTARGWLAATAVNGKIYAIGGWDGTKYLPTVELYDPTTDTWRRRADMPTHRYGLAVVAVGGWIYALGGQNEIGVGYRTTVEEYDPVTDTWRPRTDLATPRYGLAAGVVRGRIYALGGFNAIDGALETVEEYDPILNTWRQVADMPTAQISLTAATVGGRLYAIGGLEPYPSPVEEYNPLTDTWLNRSPLPTTRTGLAAAVVRGWIYAIGGYDGNRRLGTVEEYNPPFYDTDGDRFADDEELRYGRDPLVPEPAMETDTDGDGLLDIEEVTKYKTNPWVPDAETDTDGDGLINVAEVDKYGTNPTIVDTDEDGLEDGTEVLTYETNPTVADTDKDGLLDGVEVAIYETDPLVEDTDGDSYSDLEEINAGTNPLDPDDQPRTTTSIVTVIVTGETSAVFIPGFTLVELLLALTCLVVLARRIVKR